MTRPLPFDERVLNDGSRPSRLELDRVLTGELDGDAETPQAQIHQAELESSRAALPALDLAALHARARHLDQQQHVAPVLSLRRWPVVVPMLAAALALFFLLLPRGFFSANPTPGNRAKGTVDLDAFVQTGGQTGGQARPVADGQALSRGDRVRFAVTADGHESVVLLSIDGTGTVSLFYPERASDPPVRVDPNQRVLLDGAIMLDDAPGPELFVAVFSPASTADALELVQEAAEQGGQAAVIDLSRTDPGLAVLPIDRAP